MGENIWNAVLKYGSNEVKSVRKTKVRIFSRMDRINWSISALLTDFRGEAFHPPPPPPNLAISSQMTMKLSKDILWVEIITN